MVYVALHCACLCAECKQVIMNPFYHGVRVCSVSGAAQSLLCSFELHQWNESTMDRFLSGFGVSSLLISSLALDKNQPRKTEALCLRRVNSIQILISKRWEFRFCATSYIAQREPGCMGKKNVTTYSAGWGLHSKHSYVIKPYLTKLLKSHD